RSKRDWSSDVCSSDLAGYVVLGIGIPAINASSQGFFTHITPVAMQGRVGSLMRLVSIALMPLAPAVAGWGLDLVGLMPTMLVFAGVLVLGAVAGLLGRGRRRIPPAPRRGAGARQDGLAVEEPEEPAPERGGAAPCGCAAHPAGGSSTCGVGPIHSAARVRRAIVRTRLERR